MRMRLHIKKKYFYFRVKICSHTSLLHVVFLSIYFIIFIKLL